MVRAIFKSWFVRFDSIFGLVPHKEWQDSSLGKIPKGWNVKNLPEVIEVNPARSVTNGQLAPYLEMSNMPNSSARILGWEYRNLTSGMRFINGDVLLARITPCLENGKTAYVDFLPEGQAGWGSTEYIVFHSKHPLPPEYTYFLARTSDFRAHTIYMTGTSGRQRVPAACFDFYKIVVPPKDVAEYFGHTAKDMLFKMKQNDYQSRTLAAIRDTLLPKLLSGEIMVKDMENFIGEKI